MNFISDPFSLALNTDSNIRKSMVDRAVEEGSYRYSLSDTSQRSGLYVNYDGFLISILSKRENVCLWVSNGVIEVADPILLEDEAFYRAGHDQTVSFNFFSVGDRDVIGR